MDTAIQESRRTKLVVACMLLGSAWSFASSIFGGGWASATAITALITAIDLAFIIRYRDTLFARLFVFGLAAGFTELIADAWLVDATQTLVYSQGGPFVWRSPLYMPFAWGNIVAALGYIGWRLGRDWPPLFAALAMATFGAFYIPAFEYWAAGADWWTYRNTTALGAAPLSIIAAEFLIILAVPFATRVAGGPPLW